MASPGSPLDDTEQPACHTPRVPVLKVEKLNVDFDSGGGWVSAAINLNYEVHRGEVLGIVGESGSGKSSSSMAVLGLLPLNSRVSGSVRINGIETVGMADSVLRKIRGKQVAVIFQEPMTALNPVHTVGAQIVETIREHEDISRSDACARAIELLAAVEMPDPHKAFHSFPHQLSGGQRQRAMIAQAISCDPDLLIADEPTTALDVTVQAEILDLLRTLRTRLNSAIVLITHDMGVVADLADRVIVMHRGRIVEAAPVEQLFTQPREPYTASLLAAIPHFGSGGARTLIPSAQSEPVLVLDKVSVEYPRRGWVPALRAVNDLSLEIQPGELLGLVGESGSGKTTIGRVAMGLQPITEGSLRVIGQNFAVASRRQKLRLRRDIGIVFQDPGSSLNPLISVGESIGEPILLSGEIRGRELQRKVLELLDQVELPSEYCNRYPHQLSGGEKQRAGIARSIALRPRLLIADEPTSALDVSVQSKVLELLLDLQKELGFGCLFISHDLAVVGQLAHRIAVLRKGQLVELGNRDQVLFNAKDPYTQRLIAAVPLPDPVRQKQKRALRLKLTSA